MGDLSAAWAALDARGARPKPPVEVGGVRMFFLADPDGTPIELIDFPEARSRQRITTGPSRGEDKTIPQGIPTYPTGSHTG